MKDSPALAAMPFSLLLDAVAAPEPAPGSGAAAGAAIALGIACARKAFVLTVAHHDGDRRLAALADRLRAIEQRLLTEGDRDGAAFPGLLAAMRLPQEDAGRGEAIAETVGELVEIGQAMLALAREAQMTIDAEAEAIPPILMADITAARGLIGAGQAIVSANLAENRRQQH